MATLNGTIKNLDNEIIVENITIIVDVIEVGPGNLKGWIGSFNIKSEENIGIGINDKYKLELEDGRSGEFFVENLQLKGSSIHVKFRGTGSLK